MLEPEELPSLRRQLELRLKMLDFAEQAAAAAREQLEDHLSDVEICEKTLREMGPE